MLNIVVLVSGGGTNLQALLDAKAAGQIPHGNFVRVISSAAGAYALERAKNAGVQGVVVERKGKTAEEFETALLAELEAAKADLIVLAGFMTILSEKIIEKYPEKIINVHPALIPSFCGKGFYGLKVHEAALEKGVKVTGATVPHPKFSSAELWSRQNGKYSPQQLQSCAKKESKFRRQPK